MPTSTSLTAIETSLETSLSTKLHHARYSRLSVLLQGVLECLIDGTMILTDRGEIIQINSNAERICHHLQTNSQNEIPLEIWHSCEALINSRETYPDRPVIIEDEIKIPQVGSVRVRVRWLNIQTTEQPYLLVTLEDQHQSAQFRAVAEARKFGLTSRETDVWRLRRAGYSYKAIAAELFISEDTVKKHVKSIYAKRESALGMDE